MRAQAFVAAAFALALLAGCVGSKSDHPAVPGTGAFGDSTGPGPMYHGPGTLFAGPALWDDPQNTPHPGWNWPTLSHPATGPDVPKYWQPIQGKALPSHISGITHVVQTAGVPQGAGIALFGSLAVVPEDGAKTYVVDIHDPANPKVLSSFESKGRGAAIIAYPTGRLVTVLASAGVIEVVDITDPTAPIPLTPIKPTQGSHKLGVVPGTPYVYNAASKGGGRMGQVSPDRGTGVTEIFDLSDPENPVHVQDWKNGYSCHHIFFWDSPDGSKQRSICAGLEYTQLIDTKDPANPKVIVSVPVHYGVANGPSTAASIEAFSHTAGLNKDGTILYVGDENGGGGIPPGCVESVNTPAGNLGTPVGSTWFYDVSTETNPKLMGYYEAPIQPTTYVGTDGGVHSTSCTTHHGRLVPDPEGRDLLAMSYYGDGTILLDFTPTDTPAGKTVQPKVVGQYADNSNTWETWYYSGYLFTGDLARGMDVLTFS